MSDHAVEMRNVTKEFSDAFAMKGISLSFEKGRSHALLGGVGAGKTAALRLLSGLEKPDQGQISVKGKIGLIDRAFFRGKGMTLLERMMLYCPGVSKKSLRDRAQARCGAWGLSLDVDAAPAALSNAGRREAALLALDCANRDILVLDELFSPAEYRMDADFRSLLKKITAEGKTVIYSARTPWEALCADTCAVIRAGEITPFVSLRDLDGEAWAQEMQAEIGIPAPRRRDIALGGAALTAREISVKGQGKRLMVRRASFEVRTGEILCVAGLPGSGAEELCDALTGQKPLLEGKLTLMGENAGGLGVRERMELGLGYVPDPRRNRGWALDGTAEENLLLRRYREGRFQDGGLMKKNAISAWIEEAALNGVIPTGCATFRGLTPAQRRRAAFLRETEREPRLLIVENPIQGTDGETAAFLWEKLMAFRNGRGAVILFSADWAEIRALADRLLVIRNGEIVAETEVPYMTPLELDVYLQGDQRQPRFGGDAWEDLEE